MIGQAEKLLHGLKELGILKDSRNIYHSYHQLNPTNIGFSNHPLTFQFANIEHENFELVIEIILECQI